MEDLGVRLLLLAAMFVTAGLAYALGNYFDKWIAGVLLLALAMVDWLFCILGYSLGRWFGLLLGALLAGVLMAYVGRKYFQRRGMLVLPSLWLGVFLVWMVGYLVGGWLGLLTITLPAIFSFWAGLRFFSRYTLPLRDGSQRGRAFRSLLTFTLGSNYPYYVVEEAEVHRKKARVVVEGDRFRTFFAGPGIVLTDCDHSAVVSDGTKPADVNDPGLAFTGMYQILDQVIDLRPQLRAFDVEAITKDGMRIKVLTFIPFKIDDGGRQPTLSASFPFDKKAAFRAVYSQPIEHKREKKEDPMGEKPQMVERLERINWDYLVPAVAKHIVQDVISRYTVDELCAADDPARDPRAEIKKELLERIKREMEPWGVKVIGGGISNLVPQDEGVVKRRTENWQAEWQRRIISARGRGEAKKEGVLSEARAKTQAEMLRVIAEEYARTGDQVLSYIMAFWLIEATELELRKR
jgi:regulator of protease activity HflC (stomatin/prohibitin superfamily)